MKVTLKKILISLLICLSNLATSQNLIVDSLFSSNGFGFASTYGFSKLLELYKLNDAKFLACGNELLFPIPSPYNSIIKFSECGKIDSSYGVNGRFEYDYDYFEGSIEAIAYFLNEDGSLLMAGEAIKDINNTTYRSQVLIKINSLGILDSNFILNDISMLFDSFGSPSGTSAFTFVEELIDGKILCAGKYESANEAGIIISRFNANGSIDSSFHEIGFILIPNDSIDFRLSSSHRIDDNKIIFVGTNQNYNLVTLRVNATGIVDSSYGLNGFVIDTSSMVNGRYSRVSDNKLTIVSKFDNGLPTSEPINIKRFLPDGSPDLSFGNAGTFWLETAINQECNGFDILEDNRIILGILYQSNSSYHANTYILTENGELDSTFADNGILISVYNNTETAYSKVIELEDDRWVLSGSNKIQNGCILVRYTDSSLVPNITFNGSDLNSGITSNTVVHQWYFNGIEIEDVNIATLTSPMSGEYIVKVIDTVYCGEYLDTLTINILSTENSKLNTLQIFPNPTTNSLTVAGIYPNEYYLISDISGRKIQSGLINSQSEIIDCSLLNEGLYIFSLSSGENCKLIISK